MSQELEKKYATNKNTIKLGFYCVDFERIEEITRKRSED